MSDFEERMAVAKRTAVELGLEEPGVDPEAKMLARSFGMEPEVEERSIETITEEILFYKSQAGLAMLEIGKRLIEAKQQLAHGEWERWLEEKVDFSVRSAQRFMKLAEGYSKSDTVTLLGTRKALALLALEPFERDEFLAEKHAVSGVEKTAADMTAAELEKVIRERDEARRAAEEAKAEAAAAVENQTKMEADMKVLKNLQESAKAAEEQKADALQRVEKELAELKAKPVDVAVEVRDASAQQIAKAKKDGAEEAEKKHRADLDAKEQQLQEARKALADAKKETKAANERLKQAEQETREARDRADKAGRMAQVSGNQNMVRFKVLFDQAQETVNRMADAVQAETPENREKMRRAMTALAEAIRKAAEA
ncbi:MAG: DUF3102 domain-containing protein [Oscillospiraceae bacterium]|nr:DUF3102 domain-containing protein [Oscillospiraceae bacterium]